MLRLLMCLFGLHGATEIDYTIDDEEIKVCRDCLKELKQSIYNYSYSGLVVCNLMSRDKYDNLLKCLK